MFYTQDISIFGSFLFHKVDKFFGICRLLIEPEKGIILVYFLIIQIIKVKVTR